MMVGLFFFIRASTKDRTETLTFTRPAAPVAVLQELTQHFEARAYRVQAADVTTRQVKLQGMVRPSPFLAIFLTTLAAIGLLCLALVLASVFPDLGLLFLALTVLAPVSGLYYWKRAGREEQVSLQVTPAADGSGANQSQAMVTAHRDELIALQQALKAQ